MHDHDSSLIKLSMVVQIFEREPVPKIFDPTTGYMIILIQTYNDASLTLPILRVVYIIGPFNHYN